MGGGGGGGRIRETSDHVTTLLSPVARFAWYCTQPEVEFDTFIRLKHGEEKW